ncbi:hypothetical protein D1818_12020 [Aquimarina sp. BL5]|uniref:hypothetical protein n=1 Tax=Aquimarina sp. BL5 TaxID=1714860 RepID=UPI000E4BE01F|nr:hypothetical protein [Aquimarina sp. BL5]AXT51523.1 hypothetical protein D1818_12020 [Aquimarina sp. BL5]RKN06908.1 hypothetical protein D7036_08250 [Aquimarina sp. BL5]
MKTKKVIWGLLISFITISCSTDDSLIENEKNTKNSLNKSFYFDPEDLGEEHEYGMPFDNSYEGEGLIIKLVYHTENEDKRTKIRREFSNKHSDLVLVKIATPESEVEHWFLTYLSGIDYSRGAQDLPEEDDDPSTIDLLYEYRNIISKIRSNDRINIYE